MNILPRIPGEYISRAKQTLPDPALAPDGALADCYVTVPGIGRMRITVRRMKHKHGRSDALLLDGGECGTGP